MTLVEQDLFLAARKSNHKMQRRLTVSDFFDLIKQAVFPLGGIFVKFSSGRSLGLCAVFVFTGAVLGGLFGVFLRGVEALSAVAPLFADTHPAFVLAPMTMDFFVVSVSFGFSFTPNVMSLVGVIVALVLFRRY